MEVRDLRIADKVVFNHDGKKIKAEVIALINTKKMHKNSEVYVELSQKITGNIRYTWCQASELTKG